MTSVIRKGGRSAAALFAAAALIAAAPAAAGSFKVNPVSLALAPDKAAAELSIANADSAPVAVRVTALRWTQKNGEDIYEPSRDVIASPPIFTIAPGSNQLIRFGLRARTPGAAYRIIVEEIPAPAREGSGIRVALRLDLPLFVLAHGRPQPALSWTAGRDGRGELVVEARNDGALHSQILAIEVRDSAGKRIAATDARGVVLPGGARRWTLGTGSGTPAQMIVTGPDGVGRSVPHVERP